MRAGTLLLLLFCGGCQLDLTGFCFPYCVEDPGSGGGGGGGGGGVPRLIFRVRPSSATEGTAITPAIQIALLDTMGNPLPNVADSITIQISNNPGAGTLSGTTTVVAASGVATFANLSIDRRGEGYRLTASAAGYAPAVSGQFNVSCTCWSRRAPMPTARRGVAVGVVDGMLYPVGGEEAYGPLVATIEAFDPVANSWTTKPSMPTARHGLAVGVVNGVVYAVGGYNVTSGGSLATLEAYDPQTNSWTTKAPMPTARHGLAVGVVNGVLYAFGGNNDRGDRLATVEAYDPATNIWTTTAPLPSPRSGLRSAS